MKDLKGKTFGRLMVLELDKSKNGHPTRAGTYWRCQCECGNVVVVRGNSLVSGDTKSCGCLLKDSCKNNIDISSMVGKEFYYLTVIERDTTSVGHGKESRWICKCKCGNTISVRRSSLLNGNTKSCGCLKKETNKVKYVKDISNERFGKLTAIRRTEIKKHGSYIWECKCDCGNLCYYSVETLNSNHAFSCGCVNSIGELNIRNILDKENITYKSHYAFSDLSNRYYDFAIFDKEDNIQYLIEFDGPQHKDPNSKFYSLEGIERDRQKDLYAVTHNIPLYRIPYEYRDEITLELLTKNEFLIII